MTHCAHGHGDDTKRLLAALAVIGAFTIFEVIGGLISGSLALLADAGHMAADAGALALAASAQWLAARPPDGRLHFGYRRWQVLAAFLNGIALSLLLVWIVFEAFQRFVAPEPISWRPMLFVAIVGLAANGVAFRILHRPNEHNINVRGAMLHVISDLLGSVVAVVAALVIAFTGWLRVDPILSLLVAMLIARSAAGLLREAGHILLEGAPSHINTEELAAALKDASRHVDDVHGVQIWQLTPEQLRINVHARLRKDADPQEALRILKEKLADDYNIRESTIQFEYDASCPDCPPTLEAALEQASSATAAVRERAETGGADNLNPAS